MECVISRIVANRRISGGKFDMLLDCPAVAEEARPGQFLSLKCDGFTLRRPISICDADAGTGLVRIVFETKGEGTRWLSERIAGESLDLLGPLGNGFDLSGGPEDFAVFAGGGIGVPPLLFASKPFGARASVLLGFRSRSEIILTEDFEKYGAEVVTATDDGSFGRSGFVSDLLTQTLSGSRFRTVYACGPRPMLRAVAAIAQQFGVPCQVSMEERMACGVGACLGCACKVKEGGSVKYRHVCKNGPVFDARSIVW